MIILDFDGVIANSRAIVLEALNAIAASRNVAALNEEEMRALSTRQLFARLKIRWFQIPKYVRRARAEVRQRASRMALHDEIKPLMEWAREKQVPLAVVSTNSSETISQFLRDKLPEIKFVEIVGDTSLGAKHRQIKRLVASAKLQPGNCFYVGDEVADIEAAHKAEVQSVAVNWGKDLPDALRSSRPSYQVSSGEDLVRRISSHG